MRCIFTKQAESDLEAIGDYIALDNPVRALSFVREMRERCTRLTYAPRGVAIFPEYGENVRKFPFGNYRVLYTLQEDDVVILHISHGAMNEP